MGQFVDWTGRQVGIMRVLRILEQRGPVGQVRWECLCACGRTVSVRAGNLVRQRSCGCAHPSRQPRHCGQRYGQLVLLALEDGKWRCKCDCGAVTYARLGDMKNGRTTSCGCAIRNEAMRRVVDLTGQRFGKLTVIAAGRYDDGITWDCKCDCGQVINVRESNSLNSGNVRSCGCIRKDLAIARFRAHEIAGQLFSCSELAEMAGVSTSTMSRRIRALGLTPVQAVAIGRQRT